MQLRHAFVTAIVAFGFVAGNAADAAAGVSKRDIENSRKIHEQVIRAYGVYEDQAVQDYVASVGQRVAAKSQMPDLEYKFTVLDDESINAFTTGGGYVYIHRGLLTYLNSEAELAAVLGHEIAHITARHPQRQRTRGILANVLTIGAAIATGSSAVGDLANVGAAAWMQGYGREAEMEADRIGLESSVKAGYRPESMADVFKVFKAQEVFEMNRARAEGRNPNIYHGAFSSHPAPDQRSVQAIKASARITDTPDGGWVENREAYLEAIDGIPYGTSRAQGVVRENRFYHAGMGITVPLPRGWTVQNERDRILAFTPAKDAVLQITAEARPEKLGPREFLLQKLKGQPLLGGEAISANGMDGYAVVARGGSPLDRGAGPVRWVVMYRDRTAFLFAGASRSVDSGRPQADPLILSVAKTLRPLKPSEYPLAEPYRIKVVKATAETKVESYAANVPVEKYQKEELELINGLYPNRAPQPGGYLKIVE